MYNDYRYHQVLIKTLWVFQITFLQLIEICKIKVNKWLFGINRKKKCPDTDMCSKIFLYDIHVATLTRVLMIPSRYCLSLTNDILGGYQL